MRRSPFTRALAAVVLVVGLLGARPVQAQALSVTESSHNLSISGTGTVKTTDTSVSACEFCHAPHNTSGLTPLWNHQMSATASYGGYSSSTYKQINEPTTTRSKLCLSCHDGTIALGQTIANNTNYPMPGMPNASKLGTDLATDHPFGFTMPAVDDGEIRLTLTQTPPTTGDPAVALYSNKIECVTCHDPHVPNNDPTVPKFLVRNNAQGGLCLSCHDVNRGVMNGWISSAHGSSPNPVQSGVALPYTTVQANACMSCHKPHNSAGTGARLLRGSEEAACAACHSSSANVTPAAPNVIDAVKLKTYAHPVTTVQGVHDPGETLPANNARHSECADCHNPHASKTGTAVAPNVQPSMAGLRGISAATGTTVVSPATREYEVCYACHANSTNKPQSVTYNAYGPTPRRASYSTVADPFNTRLAFASASRHNVVQTGRGTVSPSMRTTMLQLDGTQGTKTLTGATNIYCSDCHNSDTNRAGGAGATGANGPHGSKYYHILERRYEYNIPPATAGGDYALITYTAGATGTYALCDKCHDVNALVTSTRDQNFGLHQIHVAGGIYKGRNYNAGLSCAACHASHGVQNSTATTNKGLMDVDISIAGRTTNGKAVAIDTAARTCTLQCHSHDHQNNKY